MENKEARGISTAVKKPTSNRKYDENELFGGELMDIWSTPQEVKSKKFAEWKQGHGKLTAPNVKAVINPAGGLSYNPSSKDHKKLLKSVATKEEEIVEKNLKELKKLRPLLYSENKEAVSDDQKAEVSEEIDSSDEEIDMDKPLAINKSVTRNDIKTQTQRNKDMEKKLKD